MIWPNHENWRTITTRENMHENALCTLWFGADWGSIVATCSTQTQTAPSSKLIVGFVELCQDGRRDGSGRKKRLSQLGSIGWTNSNHPIESFDREPIQLLSWSKQSWLLWISPDVWRGDCEWLWHTVPTNNFSERGEDNRLVRESYFFQWACPLPVESWEVMWVAFPGALFRLGLRIARLRTVTWSKRTAARDHQGPLKSKSEKSVQPQYQGGKMRIGWFVFEATVLPTRGLRAHGPYCETVWERGAHVPQESLWIDRRNHQHGWLGHPVPPSDSWPNCTQCPNELK